jgi:hypothetical protein
VHVGVGARQLGETSLQAAVCRSKVKEQHNDRGWSQPSTASLRSEVCRSRVQ